MSTCRKCRKNESSNAASLCYKCANDQLDAEKHQRRREELALEYSKAMATRCDWMIDGINTDPEGAMSTAYAWADAFIAETEKQRAQAGL